MLTATINDVEIEYRIAGSVAGSIDLLSVTVDEDGLVLAIQFNDGIIHTVPYRIIEGVRQDLVLFWLAKQIEQDLKHSIDDAIAAEREARSIPEHEAAE
jgi:hypothetical protein